MTAKLDPKLRSKQILDAALHVAERDGLHKLTRAATAEHAAVSDALVSRYYPTMPQLKRAVIRAAIKREVLPVIAAALATGDKHAKAAPDNLKTAALATLR